MFRFLPGSVIKVGMSVKCFFSIFILCLSLFGQGGLSCGKGIIVLNSGKYGAYREVEKGLKKAISSDPLVTESGLGHVKIYNLQVWKENKDALLKAIRSGTPDLIFTIGTPATTFAMEKIHDIPIVYSMITSWWHFRGRNATGVHLNIAEDRLAGLFSRLLGIESIALLCGTDWLVQEHIQSLPRKEGVKLHVLRIDATHKLYDALQIMKKRGIEGLLMVPDTDVYDSPDTIKFVLEWTKKNGIYIMGLSAGYFRMGADVAVEIPFMNIGAQSWTLGRRVLMGADIKDLSLQPPREISLLINKNTVEKKNLKVSEQVLGIFVFVKS